MSLDLGELGGGLEGLENVWIGLDWIMLFVWVMVLLCCWVMGGREVDGWWVGRLGGGGVR